MQISRAKLFESVTSQVHFKYCNTYPDLNEVIQESVNELEWVIADDVDNSVVKSITIQKIRQDLLRDLRHGKSHDKALNSAARAVFKEVFFKLKSKLIGWEFYNEVEKYLADIIRIKYNNYAETDLLEKVINDFVKYYDTSFDSWKTFASDRLEKTYHNYRQRENRIQICSPQKSEEDDDTSGIDLTSIPDNGTYGNSQKNIQLIDSADLMCDLMKNSAQISPVVYKQYRCFFTFHIAELIDINDYVYNHVKQHRSNYDAVVDIDFLNHYVNYECHSITDSYGKERKPLKCFTKKDKDVMPCNIIKDTGESHAIYTSYLGKSAASISTNYKKYRAFISAAMPCVEK